MGSDNEIIEAQFTKYLKKVIHNAATNYYKKQYRYQENEVFLEKIYDSLQGVEPKIPNTEILGYPMAFEDEEVIKVLCSLKEREQVFLLEKFLLGKTDNEIGNTLGITRQGVTNLKHRTYKKIRNELRRKK